MSHCLFFEGAEGVVVKVQSCLPLLGLVDGKDRTQNASSDLSVSFGDAQWLVVSFSRFRLIRMLGGDMGRKLNISAPDTQTTRGAALQ